MQQADDWLGVPQVLVFEIWAVGLGPGIGKEKAPRRGEEVERAR